MNPINATQCDASSFQFMMMLITMMMMIRIILAINEPNQCDALQSDASSIHIMMITMMMMITMITIILMVVMVMILTIMDLIIVLVWPIGNAATAIQGNVFAEGASSISTKPWLFKSYSFRVSFILVSLPVKFKSQTK